MVDDKDNDANDPWAGIDAGDAAEPQGDFSFSLDDDDAGPIEASVDGPFPGVLDAGVENISGEDIAGVFEEVAEQSPSPPEFDEIAEQEQSVAAVDLPATEEGAPGLGDLDADAADDTALVDEWLAEDPAPDAVAETPLAVFPGDDLHEFERQFEQDLDQEQEPGESAVLSSAIQIGTGNSGVMSPSDVISIDEWSDAGAKSLVDATDLGSESVAAEEPAAESPAFDFGEDDTTAFGGPGFGVEEAAAAVGGGVVAAGIEAAGESVASTPAAAKRKPKTARPAKSSGGGILQMVGILLGGLMALPITFAILIWGLQKDPFKFTKMVPPEMAFLLPEKFQPGFKKPSPAGGPKLDQAASLDSLSAVTEDVAAPATPDAETTGDDATPAVAADEPVAEPAPAETPAAPAKDLFTEAEPPAKEPAAPVVPEPEPLDFSGLEAAIAKADASFDEFTGVADPESPARKKLLVGWYKNLAAVAEQLVLLETAAADSARPLEKTPGQMEAVIAKLLGDEAVVGDLGRLSGQWLSSKKRPADGAVLLATFHGARQVGPYWSSSITVGGKEPKTLAIISRRKPEASAGEQVLVTGVLFDGDALWAADCRQLKKAGSAEDLF